ERITQTNAVVGTIAYLAPEVARGDDATSASDVFSLGSTLYTTVEGQPPFGRHDNPVRMLNIVGSGIIRPPENAGPLTPLLLRMLELNPATRPDAGTLHEQLRQIAARSSMTDNGPDKDTTGPPVPARSRRLAPLAGVLVAVALLAVVLAIVLADGNQVPGSPRAASAPEIRMGDDQRSIDSCALLKVKDGSLRQFDDLQQPVPGIDLGSCRADITGKYDTALVSVEISGPTNGSSDLDGRKVDLGGVAVFQQPLQNNSDGKKCQSVVRLSDNSDFYFYTYPTSFTLGKPIDLCAVTRTVAAAAVHRFASTGIPRSAGLYANYPIAARDACDTVDDATLRSAAGADPQQHYHGFANWSCHWGTEEPGRSSVSVTFQLRGKDDLDGEGASTKVAGHPAYQKQGQPKNKNNPWECQLHVVQTPPEHGSTLSQAFTVVVNSPQPQRRQCAAANTVATAVEQNLWP
ncbi:MAG: DUF3558 family protein, partial [Sciscionella sp.]